MKCPVSGTAFARSLHGDIYPSGLSQAAPGDRGRVSSGHTSLRAWSVFFFVFSCVSLPRAESKRQEILNKEHKFLDFSSCVAQSLFVRQCPCTIPTPVPISLVYLYPPSPRSTLLRQTPTTKRPSYQVIVPRPWTESRLLVAPPPSASTLSGV